jgi:hypothetical protein
MTLDGQLLSRIKDAQAHYALQALQLPGDKTEFEYGYRCGVVAGLEKANNLLIEMFKEERDGDPDL